MLSVSHHLLRFNGGFFSHKFFGFAIKSTSISNAIAAPTIFKFANQNALAVLRNGRFSNLGMSATSYTTIYQKRCLHMITTTKESNVMFRTKNSSMIKGLNHLISQRRNLSFLRIAIKSPLGRRLLKLSKAVLKGIVIFYAVIILIFSIYFSVVNAYLNTYERINLFFGNTSLPFDLAILLKLALYNELITKKFLVANEYYLVFLRYINRQYGIPFENNSETLSEFPPNEIIFSNGKRWYDLYVDILLRLAILKAEIGQLEECKCFLDKAVSFMKFAENNGDSRVGSPSLRNNGYRLSCKRANVFKDDEKLFDFEGCYLKSIEAYYEGDEDMNAESVIFLNAMNGATLNRDIYNSINELTTYYAKTNTKKSFRILINNLMFLQSYKHTEMNFPTLRSILDSVLDNEDTSATPFIRNPSDIPLIKLHISEILWKSKKYESAINWTKETFVEAYNYSRQDKDCAIISQLSINNLINMYKKLNKNGKYDEKIKRCEEVSQEIYIPMESPSSWKIFFDKLI